MADKRDIRSIGSRKGFDFRIKSQHTKPGNYLNLLKSWLFCIDYILIVEVKPFEEFNDDMEFIKPNMTVGVVASTNDKYDSDPFLHFLSQKFPVLFCEQENGSLKKVML